MKDLESINMNLGARFDTLETKCNILQKRIVKNDMSNEIVINATLQRHRRCKFLVVSGHSEATIGSLKERKDADKESH